MPLLSTAGLALFGPAGLLLPGLLCVLLTLRGLGRWAFPEAPRRTRWLGGATLTLALYVGGMQVLLYGGKIYLSVLFPALLLTTLGAWWLGRRAPVPPEPRLTAALDPTTLLVLGLGGLGLGIASLTAYWLPIWQWDSLGYHLPFVNFVLQGGGFAELPYDVPYLSTYPRNVELLFTGMRALLPDDRLVDLGQIPLGLVGAAATVGIGRELGAELRNALVAGAVWLLLPAVFLQLPTNYIDVGGATFFLLAAFFLLLPPSGKTLLCAGLATGLYLGTKPSVPPSAALLALVIVFRGVRHRLLGPACFAVLLSGALGLEAYLTELIRHGNPVWPAEVKLGPIHLPGTISVNELLSSGAGTEKVHGSLLERVFTSWSSFSSLPVFDMRVGGLSPAFWFALPFALFFVVKQRHLLLAGLLLISVVTPDPAVVRYVLALPALLLAVAAASLVFLPTTVQLGSRLVYAALSLFNLVYAFPGLTGEGPALLDYATLSWEEREIAVGANGPPGAFIAARNQLRPGEIAIYDKALWLPYLMWRSDLTNRVIRLPDDASVDERKALLEHPETRLIAVGTDQPTSDVVRQTPESFTLLFECPEPCRVYSRP